MVFQRDQRKHGHDLKERPCLVLASHRGDILEHCAFNSPVLQLWCHHRMQIRELLEGVSEHLIINFQLIVVQRWYLAILNCGLAAVHNIDATDHSIFAVTIHLDDVIFNLFGGWSPISLLAWPLSWRWRTVIHGGGHVYDFVNSGLLVTQDLLASFRVVKCRVQGKFSTLILQGLLWWLIEVVVRDDICWVLKLRAHSWRPKVLTYCQRRQKHVWYLWVRWL